MSVDKKLNIAEPICLIKFLNDYCGMMMCESSCSSCNGRNDRDNSPNYFMLDCEQVMNQIAGKKIKIHDSAYDLYTPDTFPMGFMVNIEEIEIRDM
jgi:hypothetical protein